MKPEKPPRPKKEKSPAPDEPGEFGLVLDLDECLDEFSERAKVLPFVRPEKLSRARF